MRAIGVGALWFTLCVGCGSKTPSPESPESPGGSPGATASAAQTPQADSEGAASPGAPPSSQAATASDPSGAEAEAAEPGAPVPASSGNEGEEGAPPPGSLLARLMRDHFEETAIIRAAVIDGNIQDAVAPASSLVNMEGVEKLPVDWQTPVEELQRASERIRHSPDVPEAAAATADIGLACGDCHRKVRGPKAKLSEPPPSGGPLAERMKRHAWATERLWEGHYVPSDAAWKAGAQALEGEPIPREALKPGGVYARSAAERFSKLAASASQQKAPEERGKLYASLLATCSSCHVAMKKK